MAYELHIERRAGPDGDRIAIPVDEWKAALTAVAGVRLYAADLYETVNPSTGERIRIPAREGDVEVYHADEDAWWPALRWSGGAASAAARFEPGAPHPVWLAMAALAVRPGARDPWRRGRALRA